MRVARWDNVPKIADDAKLTRAMKLDDDRA